LPWDQRILLGRIVADEQNRVRFIELRHGRARCRCLLAQRGDQAGVIGGAVMVQVVRADGCARDAPQQVIFLVGCAAGTDESDRIRAGRLVYLSEPPRDFRQGVFPARRLELAVPTHQRELQARRMFGEIKTEAALHAQEILVEAGEVSIIGAENFIVADTQRGLAAVRTVRAYGGDVRHLPGPRLVAVRAAGERADRADIDAHAAFFAVEVVFAIRDDHRLRATLADAERLDVPAFIADAHAAETQDASRGVVIDRFGPFPFRLMA